MAKRKLAYAEPADYFPEEIRKKYGLGEYADEGSEDIKYLKSLINKQTEKDNKALRDYIKE